MIKTFYDTNTEHITIPWPGRAMQETWVGQSYGQHLLEMVERRLWGGRGLERVGRGRENERGVDTYEKEPVIN